MQLYKVKSLLFVSGPIRILLWAVVIYLVGGFLMLPMLAKLLVPGLVSERIAGEVRIGGIGFNPLRCSVSLRQARLYGVDTKEQIRVAHLRINLDPLSSLWRGGLQIRSIEWDGGQLQAVVDRAGQLNWLTALKPPVEDKAGGRTTAPTVRIGKLRVADVELNYRNEGFTEPFVQSIREIRMRADGLDTGSAQAAGFEVSLRIGESGALAVTGDIRMAALALAGRLELTQLQLAEFSELARTYAGTVLQSGQMDLEFDFAVELSGSVGGGLDNGLLRITGLQAEHGTNSTGALGELLLSELGVNLHPLAVRADSLRIDDWRWIQRIAADVPLLLDEAALEEVLGDVFAEVEAELAQQESPDVLEEADPDTREPAAAAPMAAQQSADTPAADSAPFDLAIRLVNLTAGTVVLHDKRLTPELFLRAEAIDIQMNNVSMDPQQATRFRMEAVVAEAGRLEADGELRLADYQWDTRANMEIRDLPLAAFSGYAAHYLGRPIEGGSFRGDSSIRIDHHVLDSSNTLQTDHLQLGADLPEFAGSRYPIGMVLAVLTDANGQIRINIPVSGSLDDPAFSPWGVAGRVLRGTVVSALSAPVVIVDSVTGGVLRSVTGALRRMLTAPDDNQDEPATAPPETEKLQTKPVVPSH